MLEFEFENPTKIQHLFIVRRTYGKLSTINLSQAQRQQIKLLTPKRQIEAKHVNMSFDVSHKQNNQSDNSLIYQQHQLLKVIFHCAHIGNNIRQMLKLV